jgi:hypothetical protein
MYSRSKAFVVDRFPGSSVPSIWTPPLVVTLNSLVQIVGMSNIIATVFFAFEDVNKIGHGIILQISKVIVTSEAGSSSLVRRLITERG